MQFARVDAIEGEGSIADAFGVTSSPTIKAFQRTKPKGERVTDYTGPVDFDSLLEWGEAIADDKAHRYSAVGIEPGSSGGGDDGGGGGGGGGGGDGTATRAIRHGGGAPRGDAGERAADGGDDGAREAAACGSSRRAAPRRARRTAGG